MRVLVCGGRDYENTLFFNRFMDEFALHHRVESIIHGGANGADQMADMWAMDNGVNVILCQADWVTHGKAAGPIRNELMLSRWKPDVVIAFPGGRGTAHMVKIAKAAGVEVVEAK